MAEDARRMEMFSFVAEQSKFDESVTELIRDLVEQQRDTIMPRENVISYSHGEGWMAWQDGDDEETHEFQEHRHEEIIKFEYIVDHKISILQNQILRIVEGMHGNFMKMMFQTMHEATQKSGNVVDAQKHASTADAFLESLRQIEFGVDQHGEISRPQFCLSPKVYDKFVKDLETQDADFKKKVEEITKAKEAAALERESARKARFTKSTSNQ